MVRAADAPNTFSVVQFNVWQEGTSVPDGLSKIADVLIASGCDIATFSEVRNYHGKDWHTKLVAELRKKGNTTLDGRFGGGDVGLVSRFPIESTESIDTGSGSITAYRLRLPDKRLLTVCSAHLDYKHYGLNLIRGYKGEGDWGLMDADKDGVPDRITDAKKVLAYDMGSQRPAQIAAFLAFAAKERAAGHDVVLAGDFNEASHLDWTPRAAKEMPGHYGVAIKWSSTATLAAAGYADGYRKVFPDEVAYPGFTWPAVADIPHTTCWAPKSDERDRIDFIFYKGDHIEAVDAAIVGPKKTYAVNVATDNPGKDPFVCDTLPWPSDHKAVKVVFELK